IFFKWNDWLCLETKVIMSDCIEHNKGKYVKAWKCAKCGTYHFTDQQYHIYVTRVYAPIEEAPSNLKSEEGMEYGVFFEDILWDEITEAAIPMKDILGKYSGYYWLKKDENAMFLFDDKEMQHCIGRFKRIPVGDN
ncbi:hypothetical protein IJT93_00145, partial [bacterium]|nr:hypothetical protein [bacterium]